MRLAFVSVALLFAGASVYAAADPANPIKTQLSWDLGLDAQGHVTRLEAVRNQPIDRVPKIRERMEQEIRAWRFTSGKLDGQPAPTETSLNVWATITPQDDNTVIIHVDKATTGARLAQVKLPRYPESAVSGHKTGEVVLRIGYDASGKVNCVNTEPGAPQPANILVQAAEKAVRTWTFKPEVVGGYGRAGYVITPFCYRLFPAGTQRVEGTCNWKRPDTAETVAEGQALALDPAARLQTDVAGHAL